MGLLVMTCPHCLAEQMTFRVFGAAQPVAGAQRNGRVVLAADCSRCARPICAYADPKEAGFTALQANELMTYQGDIRPKLGILDVWPKPRRLKAPKGVSENVERAFLQAEDNRLRGHLEASGIMYRKALDTGADELGFDLKMKGNLQSRLRILKDAGRLTEDIAKWADEIRLLGNDAAHEADEPSAEQIEDLANLTRMALIYLFEMPKKISDMRAAAVASGAESGTG